MKIVKEPCKTFHAECPNCHAILEYNISEVERGYVHCCSCKDWFSHITYSKPIRESEGTE